MPQNKLLVLFNHLTGVEKREFSKFVASPYFNQRDDVQRLWEYLLADFTKSGRGFQKRDAWLAMYPGQPFDELALRFPMSWLTKVIERFLSLRRAESDEVEMGLHLAASYRERKMEKPFRQVLQSVERQLVAKQYHKNNLLNRYRAAYENFAFLETEKRSQANTLQQVSEALDEHLLSEKLRQSCLLLSHQAVFKAKYDHSFLDPLLGYLAGSRFLQIPTIAVYYHCYRALTEGDEAEFQRFYDLLAPLSASFPKDELGNLWLLAVNFCIRRLNTGGSGYVEKAFELYRTGIGNGILLENGVLGRFTYKNTVALGLKLGELDWTHRFIHEYQPLLEPASKENDFHYNLARYFFTLKDYDRAMELLVKVDDRDLLLNLDGKLMLLKMYYELGEFDALDSLLASLKTFIRRRKELAYHQSHYLGIIRFTEKLMALRPGDVAGARALRQQIELAEGLPEKDWLLARINPLG